MAGDESKEAQHDSCVFDGSQDFFLGLFRSGLLNGPMQLKHSVQVLSQLGILSNRISNEVNQSLTLMVFIEFIPVEAELESGIASLLFPQWRATERSLSHTRFVPMDNIVLKDSHL